MPRAKKAEPITAPVLDEATQTPQEEQEEVKLTEPDMPEVDFEEATEAEESEEAQEGIGEDEAAEVDEIPVGEEEIAKIVAATLRTIYANKNSRTTISASKSAKKKLYNSEKVVDKSFASLAKTVGDKIADEYRLLSQAMNAHPKKTLTGTIVSFVASDSMLLCAQILVDGTEGTFKVYCPLSHLYPGAMPDKVDAATLDQLKISLRDRINSRVRFQVLYVDELKQIAYVSRVYAMAQDTISNYIRTPKGSDAPKYIPGMLVEANVVCVKQHSMIVEAGGSEALIKAEEISWTRIGDARDLYKAGDVVVVKILSASPYTYEQAGSGKKQKLTLMRTEMSVKQATRNPSDLYYDQYEIDSECLADVTQVDDKYVFVSLNPGHMDCLCFIPGHFSPVRGDRVIVRITRKDDKQKRIFGSCIRLL